MSPAPEQEARKHIEAALEAAGWVIQNRETMNVTAAPGVAVREFKMAKDHGFADYLLFVNGKAVGALEAKPAGVRLANVELQASTPASSARMRLTQASSFSAASHSATFVRR